MDVSKTGSNLCPAAAKMLNAQGSKSGLQTNQNRNESGVTLSISSEALNLFRNKNFVIDNSILEKLYNGELGKNTDISESLKEHIDPVFDDDNNQLRRIESDEPDTPEGIKTKYLNQLIIGTNFSNYFKADFGSYAAKYAKVRKEIESKYTGEELENHLKWLDESYDDYLEEMAHFAERALNSQAMMYEVKIKINNDLIKKGEKSGNIVEYDKDAFKKAMDALRQNMRNAILHYGKLAKQYIIDGNAAPVAQEDRKNFNNYLTQNTDSNKSIYSLGELDMLYTTFTP